jgi:hypothetical protein
MTASTKSAQKFGANTKRRTPAETIAVVIVRVVILKISPDCVGEASAASFLGDFTGGQK